jgi:hypothetical protein
MKRLPIFEEYMKESIGSRVKSWFGQEPEPEPEPEPKSKPIDSVLDIALVALRSN